MFNKIIIIISVIFYCCTNFYSYAQPYIFYTESVEQDTSEIIIGVDIMKFDLTSFQSSRFKGGDFYFYVDNHEHWLLTGQNISGLLLVSINDTNNSFFISSELKTVEKIMGTENAQYIYLLGMTVVDSLQKKALSILNTINQNEINSLVLDAAVKENSFISSDENYIYLTKLDSNAQVFDESTVLLLKYSVQQNAITNQILLSQFGYAGADGFRLFNGRYGKGIIESYFINSNKDSYYRLYDFDQNIGSSFIHYQGYTTPYYTGEGEYLILTQTVDSSGLDYNTGLIYIYNVSSTNLVKTINLPSGGGVYQFDNYPNNLYYVKDIELPTRQIYTLKMDSIFNVLDMTSLSPSSKIVNSPPFTLTVNGHGFDTLSTVYFNDSVKTTTYVNDSVLTASISTSDISVIGNYPVWVTDEWGTSDTLMFAVTPVPPNLESISPSLSLRLSPLDQPGIVLGTVKGSNYTKSSVVYFNGLPKTTTYISDSTLNFAINVLSDIPNTAGDLPVWVNNLSTNSDTLIFSVVNLLPQPVTPLLSCVRDNGNRTFTAFFEYNNLNSSSVLLPLGGKNNFHILAPDRGQPKIFMPGLQTNVFSVTFDGNPITWTLNGISVTATKKSPACP